MDRSLEQLLPPDTVATWLHMVNIVPPDAYLAGGTGITAHLLHRISRDLDFFATGPLDLDSILAAMQAKGTVAVQGTPDRDTLKAVFENTKVEFFSTPHVPLLRPTRMIAGLRVADLDDIQAMKLLAITGRGELRDYFDLLTIERAGRPTETGISFFIHKFGGKTRDPAAAVRSVIDALGYLGDVDDDPSLPMKRSDIEKYWHGRQPAIIRHLARYGHDGSVVPGVGE